MCINVTWATLHTEALYHHHFRVRNKELEMAVSESNSSTEMLKDALESEKNECVAKVEEISAANAALQAKIHQSEQELVTLAGALEVGSATVPVTAPVLRNIMRYVALYPH